VAPPTLVASFDQSATVADVGVTLSFTDTSTTDVPPIAAWAWDFGDGTALVTTQNASHAYSSVGTYTVTLTITDTLGYSDTTMSTVTISAAGVELYLPMMVRDY
jgi:PKD repeat protein